MKVLVANSSEELRSDMVAMVERLQCRVVALAEDGHSALAAFQDSDPDIAVLDIDLDGVSGIEAARRLAEGYPFELVVAGPDMLAVVRNGLLDHDSVDGALVRKVMDALRLATATVGLPH